MTRRKIQHRKVLLILRAFIRDEDGGELVEYAITSTMLYFCLFALLGLSLYGYAYHFTSYAAREATRYAMVRGSTWGATACTTSAAYTCNATAADITAYVQSIVTPGLDAGANLTVTTDWPGTGLPGATTICVTTNGTNSRGCLVTVKVTYSFNYNIALLPSTTFVMQSTSQVTVMQ